MEIDRAKLRYLLKYYDNSIDKYITGVLQDSAENPHFSAVAAANLIKCYIQILTELGEEPPYGSVREYMLFQAFSKEECDAFEKSRQKEAVCYRGVQY